MMRILWTDGAHSRNVKVGKVPTAWIGASRAECRASCKGCPMLPKAPEIDGIGLSDGACYAHTGAPITALAAVVKADRTDPRTLDRALAGRRSDARMVRLSAIGDIGRCGQETAAAVVRTVKAAGLAIVGYTHHWREPDVRDAWRGRLMASCNDPRAVDRAAREGWRATVVVPTDTPRVTATPGGRTVVVCPAQEADRTGRKGAIDCNRCRLCDASKPGPIVAFLAHGNGIKCRKNLVDG